MKKLSLLSTLFLATGGLVFASATANNNVIKANAEESSTQTYINHDYTQEAQPGDGSIVEYDGLEYASNSYRITNQRTSTRFNYVTYKITTKTSGYTFKQLTVNFTGGLLYYYNEGNTTGNNVTCFVSTVKPSDNLETVLLGYIDKYPGTNSWQYNLTFDCTEMATALNSSTLYVTINMGTKKTGSGFDQTWIYLSKMKIVGTEGTPLLSDSGFEKADTWENADLKTANAWTNENVATSAYGVYAKQNGGTITASLTNPYTATIEYELAAPDGQKLSSLTMNFSIRFTSGGSSKPALDGAEFMNISYHDETMADENVYKSIVALTHKGNSWVYDNDDLNDGYNYYYIDTAGNAKDLTIRHGCLGSTVKVRFEISYFGDLSGLDADNWIASYRKTEIQYMTRYYNYSEVLDKIKNTSTCNDYASVDTLKGYISNLTSSEQTSINEEYFVDEGGIGTTVSYKLYYMQYMKDHGGAVPSFLNITFMDASKNNNILIIGVVVGLALLSVAGYFILRKNK